MLRNLIQFDLEFQFVLCLEIGNASKLIMLRKLNKFDLEFYFDLCLGTDYA
jgi:hypothetical protein